MMKQAVMPAPGKIEFRDVDRPKPQSQEVLMQTKRIGVCGSDIHVYHGLHSYTSYPVIQGHEVGGIVADVGKDVTNTEVGDKITFTPHRELNLAGTLMYQKPDYESAIDLSPPGKCTLTIWLPIAFIQRISGSLPHH